MDISIQIGWQSFQWSDKCLASLFSYGIIIVKRTLSDKKKAMKTLWSSDFFSLE